MTLQRPVLRVATRRDNLRTAGGREERNSFCTLLVDCNDTIETFYSPFLAKKRGIHQPEETY